MQCSVDKFFDACSNFGLTISTKKTEMMHQPAPGKLYAESNTNVNRQRPNAVKKISTSAALYPETSSFMTRSMPDLLKPVSNSAGST